MKKEEFIDLLEDIDDEYIIKAQGETANKKVFATKKWFALVAAIIIIGAFATVVAAKPEYRIFFEETELEGEKAYYVCSELEKFAFDDFSENVKTVEKEIARQYRDYEPYMSSFHGHWYRHFSSASEAKEFIGFEKFSVPEIGIPERDFYISVYGDPSGKISHIRTEFSYLDTEDGYLGIQIFADALTENFEEDFFQSDILSEGEYQTVRETLNRKKTKFYIFDGEISQTGNRRTEMFFVKKGVLYYVNFAFSEEKAEKAEDIIQKVLNFY